MLGVSRSSQAGSRQGWAVPSTVGGGYVALGKDPSAKPRAPELINGGISLFHTFPPGGGEGFQAIKGICLFYKQALRITRAIPGQPPRAVNAPVPGTAIPTSVGMHPPLRGYSSELENLIFPSLMKFPIDLLMYFPSHP